MLKLIMEGGIIFTLPIVLLFIFILFLFVKAFTNAEATDKNIKLISSLSIFTLAWGVLGQIIGLMSALKMIEEVGEVSQQILAGGLRVSSITTCLGLFVFLIGRLSILVLQWRSK